MELRCCNPSLGRVTCSNAEALGDRGSCSLADDRSEPIPSRSGWRRRQVSSPPSPTQSANRPRVAADPTDTVRRSRREIVGRRFPGAVVTDRSAVWAQPHDGYLYIASAREGTLDLPGLTVVSRKGPGAIEGDISLGAEVHLASRPRALLDNTRPTSKRGDRPPATLSRSELADWVDHLCAVDSAERVSTYRDTAEALADAIGASPARVEVLNEIVGAALGTRESTSGSDAMRARAVGVPFDQGRVIRFELLANHLRDTVTTHPALPADEFIELLQNWHRIILGGRRRTSGCDPNHLAK